MGSDGEIQAGVSRSTAVPYSTALHVTCCVSLGHAGLNRREFVKVVAEAVA